MGSLPKDKGHRGWRRLGAVLFGLGLVGLAEVACRIAGWGQPDWSNDPFVSFRGQEPLFVPDGASGWMITSPNRRRYFAGERFPRHKPPHTFRVFCFGGSTVQGNPYGAPTAFSTFLRLGLEAVAPHRRWEVINAGGLSYASYRVANLVAECRAYEPDWFIVCTGHNEFLEERTYGRIKRAPPWLAATLETAAKLRLCRVMATGWRRLASSLGKTGEPPRNDRWPLLPAEVDALLDYRGGLEAYHRNPEWRAGVVRHYEFNLRRIAGLCRETGVPLLFVTPVSNLRDCPPFKSEPAARLTEAQRARLKRLLDQAASELAEAPSTAAKTLAAARALDPGFAFTSFELGRARLAAGQTNEATRALVQARDLDVCPLRILSPMEDALRRVAAEARVPLLDWQTLIANRSPAGLPGNEWLVDHVHPKPAGHRLLAKELIRWLGAHGKVELPTDWTDRVQAAWKRHLAHLPTDYFEQGETALAGLRAWTQGRASGPPIEYRLLDRAQDER